MFKDCFNFVVLSALAKNDMKQKVEAIKSRWSNLKDGIEKMSKDEKNWKTR